MPNRTLLLKTIYSKPVSIIVTAIFILMYYVLFENIISISAGNLVPILATPIYLIYALIVTSAILLFLSAYNLKISISNLRNSIYSGISVGSTILGGIIAGCECQVPLLSLIMYNLGLNSISVSTVISLAGEYEVVIIAILVLSNTFFIYYSLGKMSSTCSIKNGNVVARKMAQSGAAKKKWF